MSTTQTAGPKRITRTYAGYCWMDREEAKKRLAHNLKLFLRVNDMTQEDLSRDTGISMNRLRRWMAAETMPDWMAQRKMASRFGYVEGSLFREWETLPEPASVREERKKEELRQELPKRITALQAELDDLNHTLQAVS